MAWPIQNTSIFQTQVPWLSPAQLMFQLSNAGPGILTNLTPTPLPSTATSGGMPAIMMHATLAPAGGAGTYTFAHGLHYTPTTVLIEIENTQGVTPTIEASVDWTDTNAAANAYNTATTPLLYINVSGNCTLDVYYG